MTTLMKATPIIRFHIVILRLGVLWTVTRRVLVASECSVYVGRTWKQGLWAHV